MPREAVSRAGTLVVKVGSSLLASLDGGLDTPFIARLVGQLAALAEQGRKIVLVSSGAVAAGTAELGLPARPRELSRIQAAAAIGQVALMQIYRQLFQCYRLKVAQVLLTRDNLQDRQRFLHARNTLLAILRAGALPIVNENDAVAVEELRLKMGDNDYLAVSTAQLVDADAVILLSDVGGLYDRPPSRPGARLIPEVGELSADILAMAGGSESGLGSGGMVSKLNAARAAALANIPLLVADGRRDNVLLEIARGGEVGTIFPPPGRRTSSYRQWIACGRAPDGSVLVDEGARAAVAEGKKSLLPIGIRKVLGEFRAGDTIGIADLEGGEFARGLSNYEAEELRRVAGRHSRELADILGHLCAETAVHRDNLVCFGGTELRSREGAGAPKGPEAGSRDGKVRV
ncbi:MAG: glutamate 5-kinase [Planctomycetota bacterium]|jgi:glutamate 5-kinase|nr:glutamate 5-kinase [Planctomycetota bacterium]